MSSPYLKEFREAAKVASSRSAAIPRKFTVYNPLYEAPCGQCSGTGAEPTTATTCISPCSVCGGAGIVAISRYVR